MENLLIHNKMTEYSHPILYKAKIHWISYVRPTIYAVIGSIGILPLFIFKGFFQFLALLLVILFYKGIVKIWRLKTTQIYLNNEFLTITSGIFSKNTFDFSLRKMEGLHLFQNFIGKKFKYGNLVVSTGEITQSYTIANPMELREEIFKQIRK